MSATASQCPLCHSAGTRLLSSVRDVEYFTSDGVFHYYGCDDCGSIHLKDPPVDRLGEIYPNNYYSVSGPGQRKSLLATVLESVKASMDKRLYARVLKTIPGDILSCLDIGGGAGWMMNVVRDADSRVRKTAVLDINENSRAPAEENGHRYLNHTVEMLRAENEFHFILMLNLIEHVADPMRILTNVCKALTPSGRLLIKTPNTKSWNRRLFEKHYWGGYHAPRHWVLFNKESFYKLAADCGFAVESFRYTQGAPQWVASILGTWELYHPGASRKPLYNRPLCSILTLLFAGFDFLRLPLSRTDQMIIVLKKK